jgi:hypothetical protein
MYLDPQDHDTLVNIWIREASVADNSKVKLKFFGLYS